MNVAALVLIATLTASAAEPSVETGGERTLVGNFMSGFQDRVKPLRAVFTPNEEDEWTVVFYFEFNGADHEYTGTARGSLDEGELSGVVENEGGRRTFTFRGEFNDRGVFSGRHAEVRGSRSSDTGTLTLKGARRRG